MFVTTFPCNECTKLIIQAGITEVIYHEVSSCEMVHLVTIVSIIEMHVASCLLESCAASRCDDMLISKFNLLPQDKLPAYTSDRVKAEKYEASRQMLKMAGVEYRQFVPGITVVLNM